MNVAEDAYFTNQYLDRRIRSPRAPSGPFEPRNVAESDEQALLLPSQLLKSPSNASIHTEVDPDQLHEAITPAQLTYLQRIDDRGRPQPVADYYHPQRREAFPVFAPNADIPEDPIYPQMRSRKKQPPPLSGYYIDQKRRYDDAECEAKPYIYTHKTFKLVFSKDRDERFNPADSVFEDTDSQKNLDLRETLQRAFKLMQKKITKDNYSSYDYYRQKQKDQELAWQADQIEQLKPPKRKWKSKFFQQKPKPEAKPESESEPDIVHPDEKPEIFVSETNAGGFTPEPEAVPLWKTKWKTTKKALEDRLEEMKDREESATEDYEEVAVDTADATILPSSPPLANFNPMWNYILSWVAYQQAGSAESSTDASNSTAEALPPLPGSPTSRVANSKTIQKVLRRVKVKNLNSKAKNIMSKWNHPASSKYDRNSRKSMSYDEVFEYPSELEVSDDEVEEAYMLDLRRQLKPYRDNSEVMSRATDEHVGIISNISSLIKSIRLMQIIFAPIDIIQEKFPSLQTAVILIELVIFVWLLYELSLLIDALCMAVRAVCAPMIAVGKFMNRIM